MVYGVTAGIAENTAYYWTFENLYICLYLIQNLSTVLQNNFLLISETLKNLKVDYLLKWTKFIKIWAHVCLIIHILNIEVKSAGLLPICTEYYAYILSYWYFKHFTKQYKRHGRQFSFKQNYYKNAMIFLCVGVWRQKLTDYLNEVWKNILPVAVKEPN